MFVLADYDRAIEYHIEHLKIALALRDRVGEGRAYWSLGNANASQGNMEKALQYAVKHLEISREVGQDLARSCLEMARYASLLQNISRIIVVCRPLMLSLLMLCVCCVDR